MGLGFQSIAQTMAMPFWQSLVASNQLTAPEFGIWLNRFSNDSSAVTVESNGGVLTFGGTNSSLFTGSIEFLNFPSGATPSFWLLSVSGVHLSSCHARATRIDADCVFSDQCGREVCEVEHRGHCTRCHRHRYDANRRTFYRCAELLGRRARLSAAHRTKFGILLVPCVFTPMTPPCYSHVCAAFFIEIKLIRSYSMLHKTRSDVLLWR